MAMKTNHEKMLPQIVTWTICRERNGSSKFVQIPTLSNIPQSSTQTPVLPSDTL